MSPQNGNGWVGQAIRRKEDPPLIKGQGKYTDDMHPPGMLHAAIVRSPEANATITNIDKSEAEAHPGVVAVFTSEDMFDDFAGPMAMVWDPPGVDIHTPEQWPLAKGEVKHVGQAVAVVVAKDRGTAVDAAELVLVDYETHPAVVDPEKALEDDSPLVHEAFGTNRTHDWGVSGGDVDQALADAEVVVERRIVNHRTSGAPIEPRSSLAEPQGDGVTLYSSTQVPHITRFVLSGVLGMSEDKIQVIAPDVGGGFGAKLQVYGEEALIVALARKLHRPVKWTETRSEHMTTSHHGRDQINTVTFGATRDGKVNALKVHTLADLGACYGLLTPFIPELGFPVTNGCYDIPNVDIKFTGVFTNKFETDAIRGAGRPEITHWIEVMMDQLAAELEMDPVEVRRKNFIAADAFPFETPLGIVYDSGNYQGTLDKLLEHVDMEAFRREQAELRDKGVYRGIGLSTYVEVCGLAPSRAVGPQGVGLQAAFWESSTVRVHPSGSATVYSGISPHGQGHDTGFAQIVADRLGIDPENVDVLHGDTNMGPFGWGTYGSRSLAVGGESVGRAAEKVQDKAKKICAALLEAAARGHRAGRRQVPGARLARQGDDLGRDLRRCPHPAERAADRHRAGPGGDLVLRPRELRVPLRRARLRGRRGRGDRQGRGEALGGGGRLRPGHQPDADRGPGARRRHPRHRPGAVRADRLRRGGPAGDRLVRRLRAAHRGRDPLVRDRPHRDPLAGQPAWVSRAWARRARSPPRRRWSTP